MARFSDCLRCKRNNPRQWIYADGGSCDHAENS